MLSNRTDTDRARSRSLRIDQTSPQDSEAIQVLSELFGSQNLRMKKDNWASVNAKQKVQLRGCCGVTIFLLRFVDCG